MRSAYALELAFSCDRDRKVYVRGSMRQDGVELYRWLQRGFFFFVCGDAMWMANDVDQTLLDSVPGYDGVSAEDVDRYVDQMKREQRYVRDVYQLEIPARRNHQ